MSTLTPEEANVWKDTVIADDDPPEQSSTTEPSIPWQEKPPTSWAEFLALMSRFTKYMGWELAYNTVEDKALAIFEHKKLPASSSSTPISTEELQRMEDFILADDETAARMNNEAVQGSLSFEDDSLPF